LNDNSVLWNLITFCIRGLWGFLFKESSCISISNDPPYTRIFNFNPGRVNSSVVLNILKKILAVTMLFSFFRRNGASTFVVGFESCWEHILVQFYWYLQFESINSPLWWEGRFVTADSCHCYRTVT
jgi:hypothetical protein